MPAYLPMINDVYKNQAMLRTSIMRQSHTGILKLTGVRIGVKSLLLAICLTVAFITTDEQLQNNRGCLSPAQAMLPGGFPFHQFNF